MANTSPPMARSTSAIDRGLAPDQTRAAAGSRGTIGLNYPAGAGNWECLVGEHAKDERGGRFPEVAGQEVTNSLERREGSDETPRPHRDDVHGHNGQHHRHDYRMIITSSSMRWNKGPGFPNSFIDAQYTGAPATLPLHVMLPNCRPPPLSRARTSRRASSSSGLGIHFAFGAQADCVLCLPPILLVLIIIQRPSAARDLSRSFEPILLRGPSPFRFGPPNSHSIETLLFSRRFDDILAHSSRSSLSSHVFRRG